MFPVRKSRAPVHLRKVGDSLPHAGLRVALHCPSGLPDERGGGGIRLETPPPPAGAELAARDDDHVSEFGARALVALENFAAEHNAPAHARAERDENGIPAPLSAPEFRLAERGGVRVVGDADGRAEFLFQFPDDTEILNFQVVGIQDTPRFPVDHAGNSHADSRKLRAGNALFLQHADNESGNAFDEPRLRALRPDASVVENLPLFVAESALDKGPPDIDPGNHHTIFPPISLSLYCIILRGGRQIIFWE